MVSTPQYKDVLIDSILSLADLLFRELLSSVPRELLSLDITMPQLKILLILHVHGPRRMSDLAAELDVTLPTATSLVDRLVEKRYVAREAHPDDRRVVLCHLSEEGQQAISHIWQAARLRSLELLQAMDASKLEMFAEALRAMHEVARDEDAAVAPN
jgi:DNA-binding MarR family transcriptional regulator